MLSTREKLWQIAQLSIAFTFIVYLCGYPFVSETLDLRSNETLYMNLIGDSTLLKEGASSAAQYSLLMAKKFWESLSIDMKDSITTQYVLIKNSSLSFSQKIHQMFDLFLQIPIPLLLWILLSIPLAIGVLLKDRRAQLSTVILPLLTVMTLFYYPAAKTHANDLYPSEEMLYPYLDTPLSSSIFEQKAQLEKALGYYLAAMHPECNTIEDENERIAYGKYLFTKKLFENQQSAPNESDYKFLSLFLTLWSILYLVTTYSLKFETNTQFYGELK